MKKQTYILTLMIMIFGLAGTSCFAEENEQKEKVTIKLKNQQKQEKLSAKKLILDVEVRAVTTGFKNALDIHFCNVNKTDIHNLSFQTSLDKYVELVGASVPMSYNNNEPDQFKFILPELKGFDCGTFRIFINSSKPAKPDHESLVEFEMNFENHKGKVIKRASQVLLAVQTEEEEDDIKGQTHIIEDDILLEQDGPLTDNGLRTEDEGNNMQAENPVLASNSTAPTYTEPSLNSDYYTPKNAGDETDKSVGEETNKKPMDIFIPNAFTPNSDGFNDQFMAYSGNGSAQVKEFLVFNRWGELVHNDPNRGWDGTYNGVFLSPGIYIYHMVVDLEGKSKIFTGNVSLLR